MPRVRSEFSARSDSVGEARRFVRNTINAWGADDLEFEASLVVSELVSNSVIHARTSVTVELDFEEGLLRVAVSDGSSRPPRRKSHGTDAATGRGLTLVEACSQSWGVDAWPGGKTVWAVLRSAAGQTADDGPGGGGRSGGTPAGAPPVPQEPGWQLRRSPDDRAGGVTGRAA
ncbi:MAG TPA: ATP-binding protein [Acidimicrobiales bacterium]|nr:ATP-binding protein [Acidimicrobiales bacterium]